MGQERALVEAAPCPAEKMVQAQPDYAPPYTVYGLIDSCCGKSWRWTKAVGQSHSHQVEKDVIDGNHVLQYFAITAAWAGDKELALQQLEAGLRAARRIGDAELRCLKTTPLMGPRSRGDPRFEKIVTSLAPKQP